MIYLIHSPLEPELESQLRRRFPAVFGAHPQAQNSNAQVEETPRASESEKTKVSASDEAA